MTIASGLLGRSVWERPLDDLSDYAPRGGVIVGYDEDTYTVLRTERGGVGFLALHREACTEPEPFNRRNVGALIRAACRAQSRARQPSARLLHAVADLADAL